MTTSTDPPTVLARPLKRPKLNHPTSPVDAGHGAGVIVAVWLLPAPEKRPG